MTELRRLPLVHAPRRASPPAAASSFAEFAEAVRSGKDTRILECFRGLPSFDDKQAALGDLTWQPGRFKRALAAEPSLQVEWSVALRLVPNGARTHRTGLSNEQREALLAVVPRLADDDQGRLLALTAERLRPNANALLEQRATSGRHTRDSGRLQQQIARSLEVSENRKPALELLERRLDAPHSHASMRVLLRESPPPFTSGR